MACPQSTGGDKIGYQTGDFDLCSCSISKQNCATQYSVPPGSKNARFNASSCVPYPQWRTDGIGVCGWAGAPCSIASNTSNCYYTSFDFCENGFCVGGLNQTCLDGDRCLSNINCGQDGRCGGYRAWVRFGWQQYGDGINSTEVKLSCVSGSGYIDMSNMVRCTDPAANPVIHRSKIGPIVGGAVGGLAIIFAAVMLWYLRKKRSERSSLPYVTRRERVVEPSRFVDNGDPWFSPLVRSSGSQSNYDCPNLGPNAIRRPIFIAPQKYTHWQVHNFGTSTQPSSISLRRNETHQSDIEAECLSGQLTAIQDHEPTSLGSPSTPFRLMASTNNLVPTPGADVPLRTEVTLLRAQMERMESAAYNSAQPASLSDTDLPPAYPQH
ncbi:hypothetical protein PILCRDRAFT_90478 [Piloderma croceum F 1598]|uniref:Uncharacterized protein n=1 Tax=Piloderma croceum (strain F 1598) TaxID=765440 RepID=A0A0C3F1R8_PILCF|nr:hypothetical protein PILCRDRAFT_90478 [Piloderma croceum F 1598]